MQKIIDISWPITENSTEYKNRKTVKFLEAKNFIKDHARETILELHIHTGTHIDAPAHFLEYGKTIQDISLGKLVHVEAVVLDLTGCDEKITQKDLEKYGEKIKENFVILLKTKNSFLPFDAPFNSEFVYVADDAAEYLVSKKIAAIGIDYLGIERNQKNHPTHKKLLESNIIIIEGLRLEKAEQGNYFFTCLPILLPNLEAAPARAIIIKEEIK